MDLERHKVLDQILAQLQRFLLLLDEETLSAAAAAEKSLLSELLQRHSAPYGGDEEYIYMNKVTATGKENANDDRQDALANGRPEALANGKPDALANGKAGKQVPAPRKSLPELPPPRTGLVVREPFPLPATPVTPPEGAVPPPPLTPPDCVDGYYEEAQPYEQTINDDGEAVSSSYESYDEEEVTRGKCSVATPPPSAAAATPPAGGEAQQHQWPSAEASIELMKDARICAFLWRKKWLGQWAKQLCVVREQRLLCYKSSKEQLPLLDVSLQGCSVVYKDKQPTRRKEHKLKVFPLGGEAIVLGLQSREQAEEWLRVIQDISPRPAESGDPHVTSDSPRLICTKQGELSASESGSSTDSHADTPDAKDVKKKYGAGLKFSNLMNIGKKKPSSMESPETSGYLRVRSEVKGAWTARWCQIRDGQLWFYQDKGRSKVSQPALPLEGCSVLPDPSPEHLYSFSISLYGTQLAALEARSSVELGHWLGLLLSQTGTRTDPEELTYDYVNSERICSIVTAAKTSLYLMQRRFSEPNAYMDNLPSLHQSADELYDDVASIAADPEQDPEEEESDGEDHELGDIVLSSVDIKEDIVLSSVDIKEDIVSAVDIKEDIVSAVDIKEDIVSSVDIKEDIVSAVHIKEDIVSSVDIKEDIVSAVNIKEKLGITVDTKGEVGDTSSSVEAKQEVVDIIWSTVDTRQDLGDRRLYLELLPVPVPLPVPVRSFLHPPPSSPPTEQEEHPGPMREVDSMTQPSETPPTVNGTAPTPPPPGPEPQRRTTTTTAGPPGSPRNPRGRTTSSGDKTKARSLGGPGTSEVKLGQSRTEADMRLYTEQRRRLEGDREQLRSSLALLKRERRERREQIHTCTDPALQASLEAALRQKEGACREAERRRVEVELQLMEVKESLRKAEAGPFTLGTPLDSSLLDTPPQSKAPCLAPPPPCQPSNSSSPGGDSASPVNSASALKNRPASVMSSSTGNVLQKAKEWEKKSTS